MVNPWRACCTDTRSFGYQPPCVPRLAAARRSGRTPSTPPAVRRSPLPSRRVVPAGAEQDARNRTTGSFNASWRDTAAWMPYQGFTFSTGKSEPMGNRELSVIAIELERDPGDVGGVSDGPRPGRCAVPIPYRWFTNVCHRYAPSTRSGPKRDSAKPCPRVHRRSSARRPVARPVSGWDTANARARNQPYRSCSASAGPTAARLAPQSVRRRRAPAGRCARPDTRRPPVSCALPVLDVRRRWPPTPLTTTWACSI